MTPEGQGIPVIREADMRVREMQCLNRGGQSFMGISVARRSIDGPLLLSMSF